MEAVRGNDRRTLYDSTLFEALLSDIRSHLNQNRFDDTTREFLVSNVDIFKKNNLNPSPSMQNSLLGIVVHCSHECHTPSSKVWNGIHISSMFDMIATLLSVLDSDRVASVISVCFSEAKCALRTALEYIDSEEHQSELIMKPLRLIDTFLNCLAGRKIHDFTKTISIDERTALEKLIVEALLFSEPEVTMYSLSVIRNYQRLVRSELFVSEIWKNIVCRLHEDESYAETCLIVLSHLLRLQIEQREKSTVANTDEFWIVLKKCFQSDAGVRRRALTVLKYALFNCDFPTESRAWWRTYFIISDSLEEKQAHLILPALTLMPILKNCDTVVDDFWVLNLIEQAMQHDSRTVRMEAFKNLFELDASKFVEDHLRILVKIMRACNDSILFRKIFQTKTFDAFKERFIRWMNNLRATQCENHFSDLLFDDIMSQKWSPVPLYYVLEILSQYPESFVKFTCDDIAKTFVLNVTHSHNVIIRSAVQMLFIRKLLKCQSLDFHTILQILELLNFCNEKECLKRGSRMWTEICEVIQSYVVLSSAEKWLMGEFTVKVECSHRSSVSTLNSLARNIVLLHDALGLLDRSNPVREYFVRMSTAFRVAKSNAYSDTKVLDNYLKLHVNLLRYGITMNAVMQCSCVEVVTYVFERIEKNSSNTALIDFYILCLKELRSCHKLAVDQNLGTLVNDWLPKICRDVSLYSCLMLMAWVRELSSQGRVHLYAENWNNVIDSKIRNFVCANKEKSFILDCSKNQMSGTVSMAISNYVNTFLNLFRMSTKEIDRNLHEYFDPAIIFDLMTEVLDLARNENLETVYRALKYVCRDDVILNCEEPMIKVIDNSWKKLEEIQATPYYQGAANKWITTFIQLSVLRCTVHHQKIEYYINDFLKKSAEIGDPASKSVVVILKQLSKIENIHLIYPPVIDILVNAFCVTHIYRKDQRIEHDTMNRIQLLYKDGMAVEALDANFVHGSEEVRLRAMNLILRSLKAENSPDFCIRTIEKLIRINEIGKKRYFGDSLFHRTKHKQLQLLLLLESILNRHYDQNLIVVIKCHEKIYDFAVRSLLGEPHQPSVRYMLEWLLVRVVIHRFSEFEDKFWSSFSEASEERIGSICSFIMIAFHLANTLRIEEIVDKAVKSTLPWTMAQHFNARLYAQSVLMKLISLNESVKQKYHTLEYSLASCLNRGNAVKNSIKLREDFYFSCFHPEEHFTFETILWNLPRLSNISRDEWISVELYSQFLNQDYGIRLYENESNSLYKFECSSWVAKASTSINENSSATVSEMNEMQRKFIPCNEDIITGQFTEQTRKPYELIVVASLIDRMPNLGGLTRTCEIFAVSALVLDSLDVVRNKEFTSLSITAEKHVPLIEVKRYNLFDYLKNMKEKEFCIIGIEQATRSRALDDFTFPSKSVIVLGNEKEGIFADLLPTLDVCIEIPQAGVIRSLNVHVSASLIVWEYAKQHIFIS